MLFSYPYLLLLLPFATLPWFLQRVESEPYSWLAVLPHDALSDLLGRLLKILAVLALGLIIIGLAGPHSRAQKVERIGIGAQIVLVLDRSASMDEPFSGSSGGGNKSLSIGEMKSGAAARLISDFVQARGQDMFGMISFSNSAMYVLPLTENKEAIIAAVSATTGNALLQTNIGSGLTAATDLFTNIANSGSRAVILLSDGGGRIDANTQQKIRDWYQRFNLSLYWIVLREPGGLSIFDNHIQPTEDAPLPTVLDLYRFLQTLRSPFKAYEAEDSKSLQLAMSDINNREKKPIKYLQNIPGHDYASLCFALAALLVLGLLGIKLLEVSLWRKTI